jgi:hypothetical protein
MNHKNVTIYPVTRPSDITAMKRALEKKKVEWWDDATAMIAARHLEAGHEIDIVTGHPVG